MKGLSILIALICIAFIFLEQTFLKDKHMLFWISLLGSQLLVAILEFTELTSASQIIIVFFAVVLMIIAIKQVIDMVQKHIKEKNKM